ncbi:uncharacterized protein LOC127728901 [Mytilus californianus]|uniref:uncharacterized protein LOC127728901 n=1 Tax=Mytilus californianus TaxID=6549 RepID=UPI002247BE35|nr:uncharacterized protein LOC127728901 [Mytilus californianus]
MSLAVLKSEQDYNEAKLYIKNVIGALEIKIFIGLYYDPVQDVFRWTDGNLLTYNKWASGHPLTMETDHCVHLSKDLREFESDICSTTRNILCSDHVAGLSSQKTSKPFVTEFITAEPTVKQINLAFVSTQISTQEKTSLSHVGLQTPKDDLSSTPMTTEKTMFRHVTTHRTDVSSAELTSQQTSDTRMSTQEITGLGLSPVRLQTPKDDISSTPMTTEKTILSHITTHRMHVSSMDRIAFFIDQS